MLGADAIAVSMYVRGAAEIDNLRMLADSVKKASQLGLPVITHVYPRCFKADGTPYISTEPEDIAWAVRCGLEAGADIVKVPYCGDVKAYRQIVQDCSVPIVAAGGPKTETMLEALQMVKEVVEAGARGATVGRNIWGNARVTDNALAYKAVIHDLLSPEEAIQKFNLING
jgi:class I fructose-bisphosphate aldolase